MWIFKLRVVTSFSWGLKWNSRFGCAVGGEWNVGGRCSLFGGCLLGCGRVGSGFDRLLRRFNRCLSDAASPAKMRNYSNALKIHLIPTQSNAPRCWAGRSAAVSYLVLVTISTKFWHTTCAWNFLNKENWTFSKVSYEKTCSYSVGNHMTKCPIRSKTAVLLDCCFGRWVCTPVVVSESVETVTRCRRSHYSVQV